MTNLDYLTNRPFALAQAFTRAATDGCPPSVLGECAKDSDGWDSCDQCWLDWLNQEAGTDFSAAPAAPVEKTGGGEDA